MWTKKWDLCFGIYMFDFFDSGIQFCVPLSLIYALSFYILIYMI